MKILKIALPVPLRKTFDYLPTKDTDLSLLKTGVRIRVPFQKRELVGIFLQVENETTVPIDKLKPIIDVLDENPLLPPSILKFCQWASDYYHHPLGEVFQAALPAWFRLGKKIIATPEFEQGKKIASLPLTLNDKQQAIKEAVIQTLDAFSVITLDGVTGSGKTEVYLQIMAAVLEKQKQALLLVPEISLTPQTIARFKERFDLPMVALHSGLTEKARALAWLSASKGEARIVIGTRSAIFTPLPALGLIIVDEEHDSSFKQQDSFRYNARDLAIWRSREEGVPIILGSATPSLETLHRAKSGHYRYFNLPERAGGATLPDFRIIDVRRQYLEEGLSAELLRQITNTLQEGNQVLLFLNRRGFSPLLLCHGCGWMAECKHCDARLTYHLRPPRLHCHYCESQRSVPKKCENCSSEEINPIGMGTEKLELALQKYFPDVPLARLDRDTTRRKGQMEEILQGIQEGTFRILIGTSMVAKGHHFPQVTLVGILDSDYGLFSSDFRATERLGQLILQVAGRAGRESKPGQVWIQTHHPDHPLLQLLKAGSYQAFANSLLEERAAAALPPYSALALFHAEAHRATEVESFMNDVKALALQVDKTVLVRGPIAALMSRRAGRHRMQLLIQADQKKTLQPFVRQLIARVESLSQKIRVHWAVDIDPIELM